MPARTIEEVLEHLDGTIDLAHRQKSRLGYFAALYRNVTIKVKEGILADSFEDEARMERLDVAGGRTDEAILNFSIQRAREASWRVAQRLTQLNGHQARVSGPIGPVLYAG